MTGGSKVPFKAVIVLYQVVVDYVINIHASYCGKIISIYVILHFDQQQSWVGMFHSQVKIDFVLFVFVCTICMCVCSQYITIVMLILLYFYSVLSGRPKPTLLPIYFSFFGKFSKINSS